MTRKVDHTKTICIKCGSNKTSIKSGGDPLWHTYHGDDNKNEWDGISYVCTKCNSKIRNNLPDSNMNLIRSMRKRRIGVSKYNIHGESLIIESVVTKMRKAKNNNIESDNFNMPSDILEDPEYGDIEIKGPTFRHDKNRWRVEIRTEHGFDTLFILCMDKYRENIECIYVIPESELYGMTYIHIYKDWPNTKSIFRWIEKFRTDKKTESLYNECYHSLILYLKDIRFFNIYDIKKWIYLEDSLK